MQLLGYIFSPDTWGTVSDWSIFAVTTVTAFYLYKTLKSQQDVQKTQNELFRIESIRFRESIKPVLKYTASTNVFVPSEDDKKILTLQVTNETDSQALEISRILTGGERSHQVFIPTGYDDRRNHLVRGDNPLLFHFMLGKDFASKFMTFSVTYQDIAGTRYKQGVFCICDDHGLEIHPFLPEIIS